MGAAGGPRRAVFDAWSRVYDAPQVQALVYRPVHEAVLDELRRAAARRIADVGCGTGILTRRMVTDLGADAVWGLDYSRGMLDQAAGRVRSLVQADAQVLPVRAGVADAVVSTESFHWFPDPARALQEFHRILRPGGQLLVGMVNVRTALAARSVRQVTRLAGHPVRWLTTEELRGLAEEAGFSPVRHRSVARVGNLLFPTVLTVATKPA
jgi:SAM-dependent methyltransferase